ncbi:MAG: metallophosphoesterase [Candidatus Magasanikbacteria bacterium]
MKLFFDLLICIGLVATAIPAAVLLYHRSRDKKSWEYSHKKITLFISSLLLFGALILVYGSFIEPHLLIVQRKTIDIDHIESPIRIALVSDFQVGKYKQEKHVNDVVEKILKEQPDIVLIAGDQVDNTTMDEDGSIYLKPLERLASKIPTYAIHGNHEYGIGGGKAITEAKYRVGNVTTQTKSRLEDLGVRHLQNEIELVTSTPSPFYLFGGDEFWSLNLDYLALNRREKENIPTIALIHNPAATWQTSKQNIDLMVSGHTHGGQIRLPFIGPLGRVDDVTPKQWYQGLNEHNDMKLFVTSGSGETGTRARLFNPPEIVILTLE